MKDINLLILWKEVSHQNLILTFLEKFETTSDLSREFLCTAILTKEVALRCFFMSEKKSIFQLFESKSQYET